MLDRAIPTGCGCDEAGAAMMPLDRAVALARSLARPLGRMQRVPMARAMGRIAAEDIHAPGAMPAFDTSAMDGFALRSGDLDGVPDLPVAGTVAAGQGAGVLPPGQAVRIFTGAPVPQGADAVVMVERCGDRGDRVTLHHRPAPGENIRMRGSDQPPGARLLCRGQRIAAHHVGLLAGHGVARVAVTARPRVGVLSTGDELSPGAATRIGDANGPMLQALASEAGAQVTDLGVLPDDRDAMRDALVRAGQRFDLILTSGAVSMGGRDHLRPALEAAGGTVHGWRVAIKPGKPVLLATLGRAVLTGLPGNPFAALAGFHLFAAPQIADLSGAEAPAFAPVPARAGFDWTRKPGRAEVFPVRLTGYDAEGCAVLERLGQGVSATLWPVAAADGLALVPAGTDRLRPGDALTWRPFRGGRA
ncbi:molybdopterin molybdotransferase MoeA [Jannaschia rubra]|uniref:Molybdopterin molybdenumtransferase n=1 Tax=Jannaschia rubra TaxID=282197 RepID=A0A0M6XWT4_9RHOB|nr:gephyrin-like molybdotransferase Glp [Jannaschia rubra]CTQ34763.1 Molybdopterin molybdenumtransferase [Jannaschia rubra]SFG70304.1 molybdopterin molybdotransferase [Jannaschia rubra]